MTKHITLTTDEHRAVYWALIGAKENIQDLTISASYKQAADDSVLVLERLDEALEVLKNSEVPF